MKKKKILLENKGRKINRITHLVDKLDIVTKILSFVFIGSYILGFITWNDFLGTYGFFEYSLLQTRYLSAGFLSLCTLFLVFICSNKLFSILERRLKLKEDRKSKFLINIMIAVSFHLFLFVPYIFPRTPTAIGGAKPTAAFLLVDLDQLKYLENLNVEAEGNAGRDPVQTEPVCIVYQNKDFIIFLALDINKELNRASASRVIVLRQDQIRGFQPTPYQRVTSKACFAFRNILK